MTMFPSESGHFLSTLRLLACDTASQTARLYYFHLGEHAPPCNAVSLLTCPRLEGYWKQQHFNHHRDCMKKCLIVLHANNDARLTSSCEHAGLASRVGREELEDRGCVLSIAFEPTLVSR